MTFFCYVQIIYKKYIKFEFFKNWYFLKKIICSYALNRFFENIFNIGLAMQFMKISQGRNGSIKAENHCFKSCAQESRRCKTCDIAENIFWAILYEIGDLIFLCLHIYLVDFFSLNVDILYNWFVHVPDFKNLWNLMETFHWIALNRNLLYDLRNFFAAVHTILSLVHKKLEWKNSKKII